jgi:subtilase family serine protease
MKNTPVLRYFTRASAIFATLLVLLIGTSQSTFASASPPKSSIKFSASKAITAIPLWKDAQKISVQNGKIIPAAAPALIPSCLDSGIQPRCYSPKQINTAYGVTKSGETGKGRTIVIIDSSSSTTLQSDLHFYDQLYGLKDPTLNVIAPFGLPPFNQDVYPETALDVETAHAVAPDATIDLVVTGDTTYDATSEQFFIDLLKPVQYAIDHNLGDVISISYGFGESCFDASYFKLEHSVFSAARAKNISIIVSAGDDGSSIPSCIGGPAGTITKAQGVSVPASDPLVTSVGGTSLNTDLSGNYVGETTWDDFPDGVGTGGGYSSIYPQPAYQKNVTFDPHRGLPDVSWDGDPNTGVPVVMSIQGGTYVVPFGGTSVGAPAWAGVVALANQKAGKRLGFLNSSIYRIIQSTSYTKAFNDIISGNNAVTTFDSNGNQIYVPGYSANIGWDAATGAGTPKVSSLLGLLAKYVHAGDGSGL